MGFRSPGWNGFQLTALFVAGVWGGIPGGQNAAAEPPCLLSVPVTVAPGQVSEAPEGRSDSNWVVQNIVNGAWGQPPFYPHQQWMARHIGEAGYDIWCRLDFGRARRIHRVRLNNAQLGSFVHLRDLRLEFSDGSTQDVTMARNNEIQSFEFPPVETTFLKIHLLSHYGDGVSIDRDSGGFGEVVAYEIAEADVSGWPARPFAVSADGHVTTWLVGEGEGTKGTIRQLGNWETGLRSRGNWETGKRNRSRLPNFLISQLPNFLISQLPSATLGTSADTSGPVDGEVVEREEGMWSWELIVGREATIPVVPGSRAFAALESSRAQTVRLELEGARLLGPQVTETDGRVVTFDLRPDETQPLFVETTAPHFAARLTDAQGQAVPDVRVRLRHQRGSDWLQQTLSRLLAPAAARPVHAVGETVALTLLSQSVGFPLREDDTAWELAVTVRDRTDAEVWQGALALGRSRELDTVDRRPGRYRVQAALDAPPVAAEGSFWLADQRLLSLPLGFQDLEGDGDPDLLHGLWRGKHVVWIDDDDDMTLWDARGDSDSDALLIDRDSDGLFDDGDDFYYDPVDLDGDQDADYAYYNASGVIKLCFDLDDDNQVAFLDWIHFGYPNEIAHLDVSNYHQDVHGNGFFLNTRWPWGLRLAWENPIAWYDYDEDGYTEQVLRVTELQPPYHGLADEFEIAFDIDNDTGMGNECDLDFQVTFLSSADHPGFSFAENALRFQPLRGLPEADFLFCDKPELRQSVERVYAPYFNGYELGLRHTGWGSCWLIWDEDDDDNRWEEMFGLHEGWEGYADHVGDRIEQDLDFSGGGQLYRGKFDRRWHLFGADQADWLVDYYALYHGAVDRREPPDAPLPPQGLRFPHVRYTDTDGNGFLDRIEYDDDGAPATVERTVSLLDFATPDDPHPDVCDLFTLQVREPLPPETLDAWDGTRVHVHNDAYDRLHRLWVETAEQTWAEAMRLYEALRATGLAAHEGERECTLPPDLPIPERLSATEYLVGRGYRPLLQAGSPEQKYRHGYWLREKVFQDLLAGLAEPQREEARRLYYTGPGEELCRSVEKLAR